MSSSSEFFKDIISTSIIRNFFHSAHTCQWMGFMIKIIVDHTFVRQLCKKLSNKCYTK